MNGVDENESIDGPVQLARRQTRRAVTIVERELFPFRADLRGVAD